MATNSLQRSIFPDLPRDLQVVDSNGGLTPHWKNFFDNLALAFQTTFSPEGFRLPQQSQANIDMLTAQESKGSVLYDTDSNLFNGNCENADNLDVTDSANPMFGFYPFAMILNSDGDPNSQLSGLKNFLCWDFTNDNLYICTTSGDKGSAVWTLT